MERSSALTIEQSTARFFSALCGLYRDGDKFRGLTPTLNSGDLVPRMTALSVSLLLYYDAWGKLDGSKSG